MPSPRKRRLRRAIASVLHRDGHKLHELSDSQKDAQFITSLVNASDAKLLPHEGGRAYFSGGQATEHGEDKELMPASGSRKINKDVRVSGMGADIVWASDMDLQATAAIGIEDVWAADDAIELKDGLGRTIKMVVVADGAEAPANGAEILDAGKSKSPQEYALLLEGGDDEQDIASKLKIIIEDQLDMEVAADDDGDGTATVSLCQSRAGASGNTAITLTLANDGVAEKDPHEAFTGGASVLDAQHYLAEDCPQAAEGAGHANDQSRHEGDIIVSHGLVWLDNPHHSRKAALTAQGANSALTPVGILPGAFDGLNGAWQAGQAGDRLHFKVLSVGGALDASKSLDNVNAAGAGAAPLNIAFTGFADAAGASGSDAQGNTAKVQKLVAGNTRLMMSPADVGNIDKDGDLFADKSACGALIHWMLVRAPA